MSECRRPLDYLLEVDLDVLSGEAEDDLARHVRECPRCAAEARRVVQTMSRLDQALAAVPQPLDVDAVLARARSSNGAHSESKVIPMRRWRPLAAVALAASIVGLIVLGNRDQALPGAPFNPQFAAQYPTIEAPADQNVAVIQTDNPDITVLWFF